MFGLVALDILLIVHEFIHKLKKNCTEKKLEELSKAITLRLSEYPDVRSCMWAIKSHP